MKNAKSKGFVKKQEQKANNGKELKINKLGQNPKKGMKRPYDDSDEIVQSANKRSKLNQEKKVEPKLNKNLNSKVQKNINFPKKTAITKNVSQVKRLKMIQKQEESEEEDDDDDVESEEEVDNSKLTDDDDEEEEGDDDDDEEEEGGDDDDEEEEGDDDDDEEEEGGDDDDEEEESDEDDVIAEAINRKALPSKKKLKTSKKDDKDDSDDDDDESDIDSSDDDDDDSSSSSSSSEDEDEVDDFEAVPWGELTAEAPRTEDSTSRLALCNMDWEHVKAIDLFVVLNSFKPPNGTISSVKVYQSDFGMERMKIEVEEGPMKLIGHSKDEDAQLRNVRKYELDKLKYFYAVVCCDSVETADGIYKGCDGMEFLNSGVVVDLRFIPDDMTFERSPTSVAKLMPAEGTYNPPSFENKALQHTAVSLTWDETPADRVNAFKGWEEDLDLEAFEARLKDYIAPPSDDDEEDDDGSDDDDDDAIKKPKKISRQETIAMYKNLLKDIDDDEEDEEKEKKEREENERKFLEAIGGGNMWQAQKDFSTKQAKKTDDDDDDDDDDDEEDDASGYDDEDDEEEGEEESESEMMELDNKEYDDGDDDDGDDDDDDDEEEEEEEEEEILPTKGKKKISNKKLVKMKIKEKKKQKFEGDALPTVQADRFKKLMASKDFTLDEKVADKTTKLKQRRILSDMKKKHGR